MGAPGPTWGYGGGSWAQGLCTGSGITGHLRAALEFLEGTYSARGYFARHRDELSYLSFVVGQPLYAGIVLAATVVICATPATALLGLTGQILETFRTCRLDVSTLAVLGWLWLPLLFTGYSLYSGNIQIYPLFLNNRYGLVGLPTLVVGIGLGVAYLQNRFPARRVWAAVGVGLVCVGQSLWWLRDGVYQLAVFQEAYRAQFTPLGRERRALVQFLRSDPALQALKKRPAGVCIALFAGELSAVIAQGGLSYAHILHEGCSGWHSLEQAIPPTVTWLVVKRGDELDRKLQRRPGMKTSPQCGCQNRAISVFYRGTGQRLRFESADQLWKLF